MVATVDNSGIDETGSTATHTINLTVAASASRVYIGSSWDATPISEVINSVTVDGDAATPLNITAGSTGRAANVHEYDLSAHAGGSIEIITTLDTSAGTWVTEAVSAIDAGTATVVGAVGTDDTPTASVASDTDELILGFLNFNNTTSITSQTGTAVITSTVAGMFAQWQQQAGGAGSQVVDWFKSSNSWGVCALSIAPLSASPTITGPASGLEAQAITATGLLLDTLSAFNLKTTVGGFSIAQTTTGVPTATTWPYTIETGVADCTPGSPANGIPFSTTDVDAAGITAYVTQQEADDGTNPPGVFTMPIGAETTRNVVQTMIVVANITPGESFFGTNILVVEDDHQLRIPKLWGGSMTVTIAADGTFTTDKNETHTERVEYFAPSTGNWGCVDVTITQEGVIVLSGTQNKLSIGIGIGI